MLNENILFIGALLLFVAVLAGKAAYKLGAPALLLFLGVGVIFGYNDFVSFHSVDFAEFVGMVALCIILFSGGMDTTFSDIRPVMGAGIMMATLGVALTALIVGAFIYFIAPLVGISQEISFPLALLLAATMSSTDSASVFSILRTKKQGLVENLRPLLELESGSNDPMAYILTVVLVGFVTGGEDVSVGGVIGTFFLQMIVGAVFGYIFGRITVWVINKINIRSNQSLYSVLLLACAFFTFSFTTMVYGNGYLAVYIAGLVVGNMKIVHRNMLRIFFDSFTWLLQIILFLVLGLIVNVHEILTYDVLMLAYRFQNFVADADACSCRYVVQDYRCVHRICYSQEMLYHALLVSLVVIRGDNQQCICAHLLILEACFDSLSSIVGAAAHNDRNSSRRLFYSDPYDLILFFSSKCRSFRCSSQHQDSICTLLDMPFDQLSHSLEVNASVFSKRCYQCNH